MKIGLVCPYDFSHPGGVANHIIHLAENFKQAGHEVKILAPCSRNENGKHSCPVIPIGRPFPFSAIGTVSRIPVSPWLPAHVAITLRREKFDILHIHEPLIPLLPLCVLLTSKTINVGTCHAYHEVPKYYRRYRFLLKKWLPKLHGKIAVSSAALDFVSTYLPAIYKIIPNGIDIARFSPHLNKLSQYADDKLNILFVGRLEKRKGLDYLLQAFKEIENKFSNVRLLVVGTGAKHGPNYREKVKGLGLKNVVFCGHVSSEELPRYYCTADIFCAPATHGESFGIVLLEAMATATPVVASNIPGYTSVISHDDEGILVEPQSTKALEQALIKLLKDKPLRDRMGAIGKNKAKFYSWENVSHQVLDYYQQILRIQ